MDIFAGLCIVFMLANLSCPKKTHPFYDDGLDRHHTNALKGLCAIVIVLGHLALTMNRGILAPYLKQSGMFAVTVFFALSGYGLLLSYQHNGLAGYWRKRIRAVLVPYAVFTVLYTLLRLCLGEPITLRAVLASFVNGTPMVKYSWFVETILLFYLAFYLSAHIAGKDQTLLCFLMAVFTVAYTLTMKKLGFESFWYNTAFSFVVGLFWAQHREKIARALRLHPACYLLGLCFLLVCSFYCTRVLWLWGDLGEILVTTAFVIFVLALQYFIPVRANAITDFLGDCSFELYMSHGAFLMLLSKVPFFGEHPLCFAAAVLLGAISFGWLTHSAFTAIRKKIWR